MDEDELRGSRKKSSSLNGRAIDIYIRDHVMHFTHLIVRHTQKQNLSENSFDK